MDGINEFILEFKEPKTKDTYLGRLKAFMRFCKGMGNRDPVSMEEMNAFYNTLIFSNKINTEVIRYINTTTNAPNNIRSTVGTLLSFFDFKGSTYEKRKILKKLPPAVPIVREREVTHEIIKSLLQHMKLYSRAFTMVMMTSGCRISEVLNIKLDGDIDLSKNPVEIYIRKTKNKIPRTVWITSEAADILTEYLKIRSQYMKEKEARTFVSKKQDRSDRLFPFTKSLVYVFWNNAQEKCGIHNGSNPHHSDFVPHALRKFASTQLSADGMPEGMIEELIGHKNGIQSVYRRYPESQMRDMYKKHEGALYINLPRELKGNVERAINESHEKVNEYGRTIADLVKDRMEMQKQFEKLAQLVNDTLPKLPKETDNMKFTSIEDWEEFQKWKYSKFNKK